MRIRITEKQMIDLGVPSVIDCESDPAEAVRSAMIAAGWEEIGVRLNGEKIEILGDYHNWFDVAVVE